MFSTDYGETWFSRNVGTLEALTSVSITNLNTIWIAGSNNTILKTTDLGSNWIYYDMLTENDLYTVFFLNEDTGWIGGGNGTIFNYQTYVVPVELISFNGYITNNTVQLNWRTATEANNHGFDVERRVNEYEWNTIGFVEGSGNSTSPKEYSFTDSELFVRGKKIQYRLKQIDNDGSFEYSDIVEVEIVPVKFELSQNYPNPFNPSTTITFSLPKETQLKINIYNALGEFVETLAAGTYDAGYHKITFDASSLSSGVYFYSLMSADFVQVKKMILLR